MYVSCLMQANPFGNAKPVDTVAKLKELEERDAKRKVVLPLLHASLIFMFSFVW